MNIPGFAAEASLHKTSSHYQMPGASIALIEAKVLPQQVIPPGLRCLFNYWACNGSCSSWPIWRRSLCYSYCFDLYNKCLRPISG